jgi:hypothetical protein
MINFLKKRAEPLHRCFTCLEPRTTEQLRKVVYEVEVCHHCADTTSGSADDIAEEIREASTLPRIGPEVPDPEDLDRDTNVRFPTRWWHRFGPNNGILRPICSPEESCLVQDDSTSAGNGPKLRFDGCGA